MTKLVLSHAFSVGKNLKAVGEIPNATAVVAKWAYRSALIVPPLSPNGRAVMA